MDLEMLFDGYEQQVSVEECIGVIETLAAVRNPAGEADERRPHYCVVAWGDRGVKPIRCVIENVSVKYTMFDRMGTPLRAFVNLKVREAHLKGRDVEGADRQQATGRKQRMEARDR
jgi:hypothetical protein